MKRTMVIVLFAFLFIIEGSIATIFRPNLYLTPQLVLVSLIIWTIYFQNRQVYYYAAILGLFYDVVYTEIIGIYTVILPLLLYIILFIMENLQLNLLVASMVTFVSFFLMEISLYTIQTVLQQTRIEFVDFLTVRLIPIIGMNLLLFFILLMPLRLFFDYFTVTEKKNKYLSH